MRFNTSFCNVVGSLWAWTSFFWGVALSKLEVLFDFFFWGGACFFLLFLRLPCRKWTQQGNLEYRELLFKGLGTMGLWRSGVSGFWVALFSCSGFICPWLVPGVEGVGGLRRFWVRALVSF